MGEDDSARGIVTALLANWSRGEVADTLARFSPSIRHRICGTHGFVPMEGGIEGMDAFLAHMKRFGKTWELLRFEPISIIAEGNRASSHVAFRYLHKPSGRIVDSEAAQFWVVDGAKVVELIEFLDTALFASVNTG